MPAGVGPAIMPASQHSCWLWAACPTALQAAAGGGYTDIVGMLLQKGADVNTEPATSGGYTALQAAIAYSQYSCALLALQLEVLYDHRLLLAWH